MAFRAATALLVLAMGGDALRQHRRGERSEENATVATEVEAEAETSSSPGQVATLYTYGAPKVSSPALRNPLRPDGCFPGWRVVNQQTYLLLPTKVDIVPTLLGQVSGYAHVLIDVQFLNQDHKSTFHSCGWVGSSLETVDIPLHFTWVYVRRARDQSNLETATVIGLDHSYNADTNDVARKVGEWGWNLASAVIGIEVVHLMQNPRTFDCILTFGGSDTFEDWVKDVMIVTTDFCGLQQKVHLGFKLELLSLVKDDAYQRNVKPKLPSCKKLDVIGHSLGGAVAALFTACAHNNVRPGAAGYEDFQYIGWNQGRAALLPAIGKYDTSEEMQGIA